MEMNTLIEYGISLEYKHLSNSAPLCVLGVCNTDLGAQIKNEMLEWLTPIYNVICVIQHPAGQLFEYPGILMSLILSTRYEKPVLYLHTKGAWNSIPTNFQNRMMHPSIKVPPHATPEDCQRVVRLMWKAQYGTNTRFKYFNTINTNSPMVACPYTGAEHLTWQNGFMFNPAAAKIVLSDFHFTSNRYYYEQIFKHFPDINVIGIRMNTCNIGIPYNKPMWDDIWTFL